ncbi:MAG: hypothetical protein BWY37_02234 [Firmicutes bacterium ADurb.Bin262]|nr:MAG: hypothetical protein BWY37_02234 [Firmicutes bacterium ADurb.Bin262]
MIWLGFHFIEASETTVSVEPSAASSVRRKHNFTLPKPTKPSSRRRYWLYQPLPRMTPILFFPPFR